MGIFGGSFASICANVLVCMSAVMLVGPFGVAWAFPFAYTYSLHARRMTVNPIAPICYNILMDALEELRNIAKQLEELTKLEAARNEAIVAARKAGYTWDQIYPAANMSRAGAQNAYNRTKRG